MRANKGVFTAPERKPPLLSPTARLHAGGAPPPGRVLERDDSLPWGDERYESLLVKISQLREGQNAITTHLQGLIPSYVTEWAYNASATILNFIPVLVGGVQSLGYSTLGPQTSEEVVIESVDAFIPAGTSGTLTLGSITIPVGSPAAANWTGSAPSLSLIQKKILLLPSDQRSLQLATGSAAGIMGLILCGQVAPTRGRMPL